MILLLASTLLLQDTGFDRLVEQLRSDKIEERNQAAAELKKRGEAALQHLEKAATGSDPELSRVAKELIKDIKDPLRGETAEDTLQKMEASLREAKTVSVKFRYAFTRGNQKAILDPSQPPFALTLKGPDKVRYSCPTPSGPGEGAFNEIVSNGMTVQGGLAAKAYPPKDFHADALTGLCKYGVVLALSLGGALRMNAEEAIQGRVEDTIRVVNATVKGRDELGRIIVYEIHPKEGGVVDATLWCDVKTRLPRKRVVSSRGGGPDAQHFTETYEGWALNAEVPDKHFTLPAKK